MLLDRAQSLFVRELHSSLAAALIHELHDCYGIAVWHKRTLRKSLVKAAVYLVHLVLVAVYGVLVHELLHLSALTVKESALLCAVEPVAQSDKALCSRNYGIVAELYLEAVVHWRESTALVAEKYGIAHIYAVHHVGGADDLVRDSQKVVGECNGIYSKIKETAAAAVCAEKTILFIKGDKIAEICLDVLYIADGSRSYPLLHFTVDRSALHPHSLHEEKLLLTGKGEELLGLGGVEGKGLLAQHVPAVFKAEPCVLKVWSHGCSDVYYLCIAVLGKVLIASVEASEAEFLGEFFCFIVSSWCNCTELCIFAVCQSCCEGVGYLSGTDNAPFVLMHGKTPFIMSY